MDVRFEVKDRGLDRGLTALLEGVIELEELRLEAAASIESSAAAAAAEDDIEDAEDKESDCTDLAVDMDSSIQLLHPISYPEVSHRS